MEEGEEDLDQINRPVCGHGGGGARRSCSARGLRTSASASRVRSRCATRDSPTSWPSISRRGRRPPATLAGLRERFHADHDRSYGHGYPDEPTELVNFRLSALGSIRKPRMREVAAHYGAGERGAQGGARQVHFDAAGGFIADPGLRSRARLGAGHRFDGPCHRGGDGLHDARSAGLWGRGRPLRKSAHLASGLRRRVEDASVMEAGAESRYSSRVCAIPSHIIDDEHRTQGTTKALRTGRPAWSTAELDQSNRANS